MDKKIYTGYIIDKSQKDKGIFKELEITNRKKIWLGFIIIYEIKINSEDINNLIEKLQKNMAMRVGLIKQEFYAHFYCGDELIVVYRDKVFNATSDKKTWRDAIEYGKSLKIIEKQLDFLTPSENNLRYFSK